MKQHQLDLQRAQMMDALYERSGRTNGLYTGLWQEFALDLAANFRDTDYEVLHQDICLAINDTQSILTEKHAQQGIIVCRRHLLGDKWL